MPPLQILAHFLVETLKRKKSFRLIEIFQLQSRTTHNISVPHDKVVTRSAINPLWSTRAPLHRFLFRVPYKEYYTTSSTSLKSFAIRFHAKKHRTANGSLHIRRARYRSAFFFFSTTPKHRVLDSVYIHNWSPRTRVLIVSRSRDLIIDSGEKIIRSRAAKGSNGDKVSLMPIFIVSHLMIRNDFFLYHAHTTDFQHEFEFHFRVLSKNDRGFVKNTCSCSPKAFCKTTLTVVLTITNSRRPDFVNFSIRPTQSDAILSQTSSTRTRHI